MPPGDRSEGDAPSRRKSCLAGEGWDTLTAFSEATEMTGHASFLEADGLSTFRTGFSKEAVMVFVAAFRLFIFKVSLLQDSTYGVGDGQNQSILLKDRMFPAYTFELFYDIFHMHP